MSAPFAIDATATTALGTARAGRLSLRSGTLETPALLPDLTHATGRGISPWDLDGAPIRALKVEPLELMERPGAPLIGQHGGIQGLLHFPQPTLSTSGGQAASLDRSARLEAGGIRHRRPIDGRPVLLSPQGSLAFQATLDTDITTALGATARKAAGEAAHQAAVDATRGWLDVSLQVRRPRHQLLFATVPGGPHVALRRRAAEAVAAAPVDGFSLAPFAADQAPATVAEGTQAALSALPGAAVRHVREASSPAAILDAIGAGADLIDCTFPTRHARNGYLYIRGERIQVTQSRYRSDMYPPDTACGCPVCQKHTRAYLNHLFRIKETLGTILASLHNLWWVGQLVSEARAAVVEDRLEDLRTAWLTKG